MGNPSETDVRQGVRRLRALLPAARADARNALPPAETSELARATIAGLTEANFRALVVYPAERGGWHCDLQFKNVPPGMPNCMGSPVGMPFHTREEAEAYAPLLLSHILATLAARDAGTIKPSKPVFLLHDTRITLAPAALAKANAALPAFDLGQADALAGLHRTLGRLGLRERCTPDDVRALDATELLVLLAALHAAAVCGIYVWPHREPRQPGPETALQMAPDIVP